MITKRYHLYKMDMIIQVWSEIQNCNSLNTQTPLWVAINQLFQSIAKIVVSIVDGFGFCICIVSHQLLEAKNSPTQKSIFIFSWNIHEFCSWFCDSGICVYIVICALRMAIWLEVNIIIIQYIFKSYTIIITIVVGRWEYNWTYTLLTAPLV